MIRRPAKSLLVDAVWLLGGLLVACVFVGGSVYVLNSRKAEVDGQRASLQAQEARVIDEVVATGERARLDASLARLAIAQRMVESDARRGAALSKAARAAGVSIVLIKSGDEREPTESGVVSRSHELSVVADYRQLATFLDALYRAEGIVGIDSVEIESDGAGRQTASLEVSWFSRRIGSQEDAR